MHPLAILVVWKFFDIGRSEVKKNEFSGKIPSPTTFRPGMLERWNSVFRAKWFLWEKIWPGEVFRRGSPQIKFGKKRQLIFLLKYPECLLQWRRLTSRTNGKEKCWRTKICMRKQFDKLTLMWRRQLSNG